MGRPTVELPLYRAETPVSFLAWTVLCFVDVALHNSHREPVMRTIAKQRYLAALALSVALTLTGCKSSNNNEQPNTAPQGDPSAVNEAPAGDQNQAAAPSGQASSSQPATSAEPEAPAEPASDQSEAQSYPQDNYYPDYASNAAAL